MAKGPRFRVQLRRKREGKTDYRRRLKLLKSGKPRLVVRVTSRRIQAQVCGASSVGDHVFVQASSEHLEKYGWKGSKSNTPAAYLVGYLCGKRALGSGIKECVLDIGLHAPKRGARVFAALKGALDAGLLVPHREEMLPEGDRILGKHIAEYARRLKDSEAYERQFSRYLRRGMRPEEVVDHFQVVKGSMAGAGE
jgi:large subunit ribosomal protein L18